MDHESISDNQDIEDGEVSFIDLIFKLQRKSSSIELRLNFLFFLINIYFKISSSDDGGYIPLQRPEEIKPNNTINPTTSSANVMEDESDTDFGVVGNSESDSSGSDCDSFNKIKKKKISKSRFE